MKSASIAFLASAVAASVEVSASAYADVETYITNENCRDNFDPEAIFELRWSARIPLARPGGAGHDEKTSWHGSNRNGVASRLCNQQSTQKPALFATRSLAVHTRSNMPP